MSIFWYIIRFVGLLFRLLFEEAEGFTGIIWAINIVWVGNVEKFITDKTKVNYQV